MKNEVCTTGKLALRVDWTDAIDRIVQSRNLI